jgi:hypothetical protein
MAKPLSQTNPYLLDPVKRQEMIFRSVLSSSAIEGVHKAAEEALSVKENAVRPPSVKPEASAR